MRLLPVYLDTPSDKAEHDGSWEGSNTTLYVVCLEAEEADGDGEGEHAG